MNCRYGSIRISWSGGKQSHTVLFNFFFKTVEMMSFGGDSSTDDLQPPEMPSSLFNRMQQQQQPVSPHHTHGDSYTSDILEFARGISETGGQTPTGRDGLQVEEWSTDELSQLNHVRDDRMKYQVSKKKNKKRATNQT